MYLPAKDQVKILLAQEHMTLKTLASELGKKLNKDYSADNLSHKLRRGTFSYNEMLVIAQILGYEVIIKKNKQ